LSGRNQVLYHADAVTDRRILGLQQLECKILNAAYTGTMTKKRQSVTESTFDTECHMDMDVWLLMRDDQCAAAARRQDHRDFMV